MFCIIIKRELESCYSYFLFSLLDNRFTDDIHWKGGCVLGNGLLSWSSCMFAWKAEPPNPNNSKIFQLKVEYPGETSKNILQ